MEIIIISVILMSVCPMFICSQELRETIEQLRSELQVKVCDLRDRESATRSEITDRDKTIAQLQQSLCRKDALLQVRLSFMLKSTRLRDRSYDVIF